MSMITQADMDRLKLMVDRNPQHGAEGGSSTGAQDDDLSRRAHDQAHRFYNYQVHKWLDEVSK